MQASFVLCRVFAKSRKSKGSENPLSSCGEGSVATVRHIGIQHDGYHKLVNGEDKMLDNKFFDHNNKVLGLARGLNSEPHEGVTSEPSGVKVHYYTSNGITIFPVPLKLVNLFNDYNFYVHFNSFRVIIF